MKKLVVILLIALYLIIGLTGCSSKQTKYNIEISVKDYGIIKCELDGKSAPITVDNFVKLVNEGFYDGTSFHRIIDGFMIQGGSANTEEKKNSLKTIKGEFSKNGVNNPISHERGVISMARSSSSYDSASSQFFIMQKTNTSLDGNYAAFGKVTEGMDVVDLIAKVKTEDENGIVLEENRPIIEYIKVID